MTTLMAGFDEEGARLARGRAMVLLATLFWSIGGPLVRFIQAADAWQILFYRSASLVVFLCLYLALTEGRRALPLLRSAGWPAALAGLCIGFTYSIYVLAITTTTVANVLFLLSCSPILGAVLGQFLLGERVRRTTWVAMAVALVGVGIMVSDGLAGGGSLGDILGLAAALGFALYSVVLRWRKNADMLPSVFYGGLFGTAFATTFCLAGGLSFLLTPADTVFALLLGTLNLGVGLVLYTRGARVLPVAEGTLLSLLEVVLGPLLTWLLVGEVPAASTLAGGLVLLAAVLIYASTGLSRRRPPTGVVS
ncbi:rarD protein [Tistlia consotensis]|uniref:RarD protein n=1 Tax=Tistlia consotensis USBA 355 TaxID=560819 RepID=A0A1Y6B4C0_9PROT|nr:DMT family transporter [Tistlia consotensis]SME88698.1 rarD protein [Tistlia consotensis USBA 355]SNR25264.1 rarD protein [Tistlia consotensis]